MREVEWRMMPAKVSFDGWDENMDVRVAAYGSPEHIKIKFKAKGIIITIVANREKEYGAPEDSFEKIAAFWSVYLEEELLPEDVANMMILLKIAREMGGHKDDNMIDIAGYAACGNNIWDIGGQSNA